MEELYLPARERDYRDQLRRLHSSTANRSEEIVIQIRSCVLHAQVIKTAVFFHAWDLFLLEWALLRLAETPRSRHSLDGL